MNIAIFGSCVSRDTCEFISDSTVIAYVARQSSTSLETPHGTIGVDLSGLGSPFQKRMVTSDLRGDGIERVTEHASELDLILVDLIDERRGYWLFTDGTTMTNSLEVEACGAASVAEANGARLVQFGTDEHFEFWKQGFEVLIGGLKEANCWKKTVFLDIEWACALEGSQHPHTGRISKIGRRWRKFQRGARGASRSISSGRGLNEAWSQLTNVKPTEAEDFADRAATANEKYLRYRKKAQSEVAATVTRLSNEVRISRDHKWGPQPFHYRDEDYRSIVRSLRKHLKHSGGELR